MLNLGQQDYIKRIEELNQVMESMHYSTTFRQLKNCTLFIAELNSKENNIITYSVEDTAFFHN